MENDYCPHCGAKHYIEELNFILFENIDGHIVTNDGVIFEQSAKRVKSNFTNRCISCGHEKNIELKH